jgi:phage protein D
MGNDLFYRVSVTAGSAQYDLSQDLTSLTIEEDSAKPDQLTVVMSDPFKVLSHAIQEGMEVEVELGTADDHSVLFRGRIYKTDGEFPQDGVPTHRITAYDKSMQMGLQRRNRRWADRKLSEIIEEIAQDSFDGEVEVNLVGDPEFSGNGVRQTDETDLAFLHRLGAMYGFEVFVVTDDDTDTLHCEAQYQIMTRKPEITLYYGRCNVPNHLITFQASSNVSDIQLPRVFSGIEYETGELAEVTTAELDEVGELEDRFLDENLTEFRQRDPERANQLEELLDATPIVQQDLRQELGGVERESTPGFTTAEELEERAKNQFSTSLRGMRGSGKIPGNQRIRAQSSVGIADVGGRFSGTWYLSQVRHILDRLGYQTEITCQR